METTKVRLINDKIYEQAMRGTCSVNVEQGRVIHARSVKGQLQVKTMGADNWIDTQSVTIEDVQPGPASKVRQKGGYTTTTTTRYTVKVDLQSTDLEAYGTYSAAVHGMKALGVTQASKVTAISGNGERASYINAKIDANDALVYERKD